jgi:Electron transfer DM13
MENAARPITPRRRLVRRLLVGIGLCLVVLVAFGAYWLQPWKLWTSTTVNEATPSASASAAASTVLSEGRFISHEHSTTGTAKLLQLSDGTKVLRLEDLATSEGPKVQVLLSDAPVISRSEGYRVFDEGRYVDLGPLKGNKGNANYVVPAGVDVDGLTSVSIWCDRFDVSFGAAELSPRPGATAGDVSSR